MNKNILSKLEVLHRSSFCEYSVIENKLAILYQNQEKIYKAIGIILNELIKNEELSK